MAQFSFQKKESSHLVPLRQLMSPEYAQDNASESLDLWIDDYLNQQLKPSDRRQFEKVLMSNQDLMHYVAQYSERHTFKTLNKKRHFDLWVFLFLFFVLILVVFYFYL